MNELLDIVGVPILIAWGAWIVAIVRGVTK